MKRAERGVTRRKFITTTGGAAIGAALIPELAPGARSLHPKGDFDFIVVGTGSGGGIMIHRLVTAGYRVLALEAGIDMPRPVDRRAEATQVTIDDEFTKDWPFHAESELTGYGFR